MDLQTSERELLQGLPFLWKRLDVSCLGQVHLCCYQLQFFFLEITDGLVQDTDGSRVAGEPSLREGIDLYTRQKNCQSEALERMENHHTHLNGVHGKLVAAGGDIR